MDYNNIIYNSLNFIHPLNKDINNNISIDLNVTGGWTKDNSFIYTNGNNIGIGISTPLASLHIGTMKYSTKDLNDNDGTLIISKTYLTNINKNFKFGYDNNCNFILGDFTTSNWNSRIIWCFYDRSYYA